MQLFFHNVFTILSPFEDQLKLFLKKQTYYEKWLHFYKTKKFLGKMEQKLNNEKTQEVIMNKT